ncbi:MAG: peptide chain release factor N(5)-glutamine methyltransferase [Chloroflexota bacterium]|nr:peptide chain release factor N(5)-glutamine methyltransferase [Chloroflexota bacterium]
MSERSIAEALGAASARLAAAGRETPRLDAEVLLRHVLGVDRAGLFVRLREPLPVMAWATYEDLVTRRLAGEPVAYLTGVREFMGLDFAVRPGVLVPRPETELLVEWALGWLGQRSAGIVLDVGTGSGAIAVGVAAHLPPDWEGRIIASDVSTGALAVAAANCDRHGVRDRVRFVRGDLATWCGGPVGLLLANLPYLRPDQVEGNADLRPEPVLALLGGADGLDLIRRLIGDAPRVLAPGGALALEIDPSQAEIVAGLVSAALPDAAVEILPDLVGLARYVVARRRS